MEYELTKDIQEYLASAKEETIQLIKELCNIPSPTGHEEKRAEFCQKWLCQQGAENVVIDSAKNVIYSIGCDKDKPIVLFTAHTDTVFPDLSPMPFYCDEEYLYSPGVGDDTTCLAILLILAKYIANHHLVSDSYGILIVANSCEEGLGNLKGIKQIMKEYGNRICEVYAFDGQYCAVVNECVGSHRYEIIAETKGGHSFRDFGNENAIAVLSELVCRLYKCQIPTVDGSITTYNVGKIEGGTSVNSIAQKASILYEYRSNNIQCLEKMHTFLNEELSHIQDNRNVNIKIKQIGNRPCGNIQDQAKLKQMTEKVIRICQKYSQIKCYETSGSTDCNIPMSLGIPAICVGSYIGQGEHTREEKVRKDSIAVGLKITAELVLSYF